MPRFVILSLAVLAACSAPVETPIPNPASPASTSVPTDDGTYLSRVDPLGGQWKVTRVGAEDFTAFEAWVNFSEGGFLNHGAGCSGGYPAFYRLDDDQITLTRIEPVRTGRCEGFTGPTRTDSIASEHRLAAYLDQLTNWARPDMRTLVLTGRDGVTAVLTRPVEPHPELAGRWLIESIAGQPLVTETRPPILTVALSGISAHGDCNSFGTTFAVPATGRLAIGGPVVSTAMGCLPEDAAEDQLMAQAITGAIGYQIEGDRLTLTGGLGLSARRPAQPDRRLTGEYTSCGNTLLGGYHEGPVTLTISEHVMQDNSGCRAEYTARGSRLEITPDPATCTGQSTPFEPGQPVGIGGNISTLTTVPPEAFAFDDQGRLILRTHRGLLGMCRVGTPPMFGQ